MIVNVLIAAFVISLFLNAFVLGKYFKIRWLYRDRAKAAREWEDVAALWHQRWKDTAYKNIQLNKSQHENSIRQKRNSQA